MSSFPVLRTRLSVCFLSSFPDSLPQPFLRCFPFALAFGLFPFLPFSFVYFCSGSDYSASVSSFPLSSRFPLTVGHLSVLPFRSRFCGFPRSLLPDFSCLPPRFLYSASLMVSFRPSLIHSRSCSSGAYLVLLLSVFSLSFCFLSSASVPVPATRPLFLPFLFLPVSASQRLPRCALSAFASLAFPVLSDLVSHVFFPGSSYSAFCLFPFILPGFAPSAVPPVLPLCSRFRAFPFQSAFFRPLLFRF